MCTVININLGISLQTPTLTLVPKPGNEPGTFRYAERSFGTKGLHPSFIPQFVTAIVLPFNANFCVSNKLIYVNIVLKREPFPGRLAGSSDLPRDRDDKREREAQLQLHVPHG